MLWEEGVVGGGGGGVRGLGRGGEGGGVLNGRALSHKSVDTGRCGGVQFN